MAVTSEALWLAMQGELAGFFRRRVRDEHVVDDLVAETFLRVHERLTSVHDEERIAAWVYRIARNVLADHGRRNRGADLETPEQLEDPAESAPNFNSEVNGWLERFLAEGLAAEQREAVELSDVQGLSQPEIAAKLGLSLSATKSRVQRGRQRLRELVDACCHVDFDRRQNVIGYRRKGSSDCCGPEECA